MTVLPSEDGKPVTKFRCGTRGNKELAGDEKCQNTKNLESALMLRADLASSDESLGVLLHGRPPETLP